MQSHASTAAFLVGEALLAGCVLATLAHCVEPRAIAAAYGTEIPTKRSTRDPASVRARDFIGEVRLGHGLDVDGKVPPSFGATKFAVGDPIHLSMWDATHEAAGSVVHVSVRDAADRIVWSADKEAPRGGSYLSFAIGRTLVRGKYLADVVVDRELRSRTGFEVFEWKDR